MSTGVGARGGAALPAPLRSLLFAPGDDERKLAKALAGDADAVIADLEDAVAPAAKVAARACVERALGAAPAGRAALVRVNAMDTPWALEDLELAGRVGAAAVVLPKATPASVARLADDGPAVIAIVETALGVHRAFEVASHPRVRALLFGALDLSAEIAYRWTASGEALLRMRSKLVLESAAAGIAAPLDTAWLRLGDVEGLATEAEHARGLGLQGKACIHPSQVPVVNAAFSTAEEVEWARGVIAAYDAALARGDGVIAVEGEMVDMASLRRAHGIMERAGAGG